MASTLKPHARLGYGLGSLATGAFGTVPGLLLLPYLTDRLGVAAGIAGLIVLLPKAWDVLLNPIAGRISDRSEHPEGRRRWFLIRAGLVLAVLFALIFAGPTAPPGLAATWVLVAFLACASAYAFFQVPYVAMPAEMTDDAGERTRIMTWRVAILALAILLSGGLSPMIRDGFGVEWGYRAVGIFVGVLIAIGAFAAWHGTRHAPEAPISAPAAGLAEQLRLVWRSRDFRALLVTFVVQALAVGAMLAGVDYLARWVLGSTGASTVLFVCFVGPALLVTPLWQRLGEHRDKRAGYAAASLLMAIGALAVYLLRGSGLVAIALAVTLIGIGYAGAQMFPLSMLGDTSRADAETSRQNRVGVFTGVWTAGETLGLALGPALYAGVLAAGGYVSSTGDGVSQPASAVHAVALGFGLIPAALIALSFLALRGYGRGATAVHGPDTDGTEPDKEHA